MRHASFVTKPTIITEPGSYTTRSGEVVEIENIEMAYGSVPQRANGRYSNGVAETWDICGRLLPFSESQNDIVCKNYPS